jgi:1,4-dihydroxy-2-naphthoyl-CoA hydrolase
MASIWIKEISLEKLNSLSKGNMLEHLAIEFTDFGDDYIEAIMPVDNRTTQPFGYLHGGASVVLAETLGSVAGNFACGEDASCLGLDIFANHIKAVKSPSIIKGRTYPINVGKNIQIWQIDIKTMDDVLVCSSKISLYVRRGIAR